MLPIITYGKINDHKECFDTSEQKYEQLPPSPHNVGYSANYVGDIPQNL